MALYIASIEEILSGEEESASDSLELGVNVSIEQLEEETATDEVDGFALSQYLLEEEAPTDEVTGQNYTRSVEEPAISSLDSVDYQVKLFLTQNLEFDLQRVRLYLTQALRYNFPRPFFMVKNFYNSAYRITFNIRSSVFSDPSSQTFSMIENEYPPIFISAPLISSLLGTNKQTTVIKPQYKILLDGVDVTNLVLSCTINYDIGSFSSDIDITWAHTSLTQTKGDTSLYDLIDCSDIALNYQQERVVVYTRLATNDNPTWVLQGSFFLEKRGTAVTYNAISPTSWGRNRTARLSLPYSKPLTKTWLDNTTARSIAQELCTNAGVTLSWEIADFKVLGSNISVDGEEPINVISSLAQVVGGVLTTDKSGRLRVIYRFFS